MQSKPYDSADAQSVRIAAVLLGRATGKIIDYAARLAQLFRAANPRVDVRLVATCRGPIRPISSPVTGSAIRSKPW
jgi:hypothetical protein